MIINPYGIPLTLKEIITFFILLSLIIYLIYDLFKNAGTEVTNRDKKKIALILLLFGVTLAVGITVMMR